MDIKVVGIAGGSGAGKSTVCYKIVDQNPEQYEIINLDDFQKLKSEPNLPMLNGKINWDHPDIIDWAKVAEAIETLQGGEAYTTDVWSHRSNPNYSKHGKMIPRTILPRPVILLEGYLALYNPELNSKYSRKYYLDIGEEIRNARRGKNDVIDDPEYVTKVLISMHKQFVEPTKAFADVVIDVSNLTVDEVAAAIKTDLRRH